MEAPDIDGYSGLVRVAKGGFGVVYRAHQDRFDRVVALKVLNVEDVDDRARKKFERECSAVRYLCPCGVWAVPADPLAPSLDGLVGRSCRACQRSAHRVLSSAAMASEDGSTACSRSRQTCSSASVRA